MKSLLRVYLDTCTWIRAFENNLDESEEINKLIALNNKQIKIVSSKKVEKELNNLIVRYPNEKKYIDALDLMKKTVKEFLPYPSFVLGDNTKGLLKLSRLGDNSVFKQSNLKEDIDVAEFLVKNKIDYFITIDEDFRKKLKRQLNSKNNIRTEVLPPSRTLEKIINSTT